MSKEQYQPDMAAAAVPADHIVGEELLVDSSTDSDSTFGDAVDSTTTSLASGVTNYRYEHGRRYHGIEDGRYSLPNDEAEVDRLNFQHRVWEIALNGHLYVAPIDHDSLNEVLDVGCGTGAWCIEFADAHPGVQVLGTDLSPIQPHNIPANCQFIVDDANDEWVYGERFDFIHTRTLLLGVKDWKKVVQQAFGALKPGGWIELHEFHIPIACDDGSASPDSAVMKWGNSMYEGFQKFGVDSMATAKFRDYLEQAGFEDIRETHTKFPLGPWPRGDKEKAMGALFQKDIGDNLHGLSVKTLTQGLGWSSEEVDEFIPQAKADMYNPQIHTYFPIDIFWARKPQ
ncbi:S-adenosyl-L-methionine-dependent methyltransferase [Phyllosticta citricarpa]